MFRICPNVSVGLGAVVALGMAAAVGMSDRSSLAWGRGRYLRYGRRRSGATVDSAMVTLGQSRAAIALLRALNGPPGIRASLSTTANYDAVFTRDAVMAGVAGLLAGDAEIAGGLVRTLTHLRELQGPEGQIASNYRIRSETAPRVSFGTLAPRIDSTTWYLVGI